MHTSSPMWMLKGKLSKRALANRNAIGKEADMPEQAVTGFKLNRLRAA